MLVYVLLVYTSTHLSRPPACPKALFQLETAHDRRAVLVECVRSPARMVEFWCVKCFKCGTFQVQQAKKSAAFRCSLCAEKQSIVKRYAISNSAKDVRLMVMQLNAARVEQEEARLSELEAAEEPQACYDDAFEDSGAACAVHSIFQVRLWLDTHALKCCTVAARVCAGADARFRAMGSTVSAIGSACCHSRLFVSSMIHRYNPTCTFLWKGRLPRLGEATYSVFLQPMALLQLQQWRHGLLYSSGLRLEPAARFNAFFFEVMILSAAQISHCTCTAFELRGTHVVGCPALQLAVARAARCNPGSREITNDKCFAHIH